VVDVPVGEDVVDDAELDDPPQAAVRLISTVTMPQRSMPANRAGRRNRIVGSSY